jgi:hypothetical protein
MRTRPALQVRSRETPRRASVSANDRSRDSQPPVPTPRVLPWRDFSFQPSPRAETSGQPSNAASSAYRVGAISPGSAEPE